MDSLRHHLQDALVRQRPKASKPAGLLCKVAHWGNLVQQAGLSLRGLDVRRIEPDPAVQQSAVKVTHKRPNVPARVWLASLSSLLQGRHVLLELRGPEVGDALVPRVDALPWVGNLQVGVGHQEFPNLLIHSEAVHASAERQHQDC